MDNFPIPDGSDHGPRKGGHSLRKRARVDYTFEHIDDDVIVPNSTSSARGKKRRSEVNFDTDDFYTNDPKRRGASMGADTPSNRRKNPTRKSSDLKAFHHAALQDDDNDVQDTIEVGAYYSDVDDSELREPAESNHSSPQTKISPNGSPKKSPKKEFTQHELPGPQADGTHQLEPESVHSPIVPAAGPELVNSIAEVPAAEPLLQDNPEPNSSATNNISIKEEAPYQTTLEEVPESPDQPLNQHQENKMDEMEIDPVNQGPLAQDVEMADAAPLDTQDPTPAAAISPSSPPPPPPAAPSPLPSKTPSTPPPKSLAKSVSEPPAPSPAPSPVPSPAKELEDSQHVLDSTSPPADAATEAPVPVDVNGDSAQVEQLNNEGIESIESVENNKDKEAAEVVATANELPIPDSPHAPVAQEPVAISSPTELRAPTPPPAETIETPASSAPSETKSSPQKPVAPRIAMESMPQPTPVGRWAHLKPYVDGEFVLYPEKKGQSNEDGTADDANPEGKDTDMEPMVDDQDDAGEGGGLEAPTPALNTPTRGSPVADSADPTAFNSPAPIGEDGDEADVSESQELPGRNRYYKYRKLRDPEEYISAVENYEDMSTEDLFEVLEAINVSLVQWQDEWTDQGAIVDDHENSLRRRAADAKYEARTRNLRQHGVNYEEPEFAVKGYKSRDKEGLNETRYLQGQDRIMAATYGFEYDPHPSKIGKQNPETQQVGIMTRGRSLRNQPKQTAKATETDEVVGKRQRKPVQLFDPATQDVSRSSTPVPTTRGGARRRKNANGDDDVQPAPSVSFNNEGVSDSEAAGPKTRRKRGTRGKNAAFVEDPVSTLDAEEAAQEEPSKSTRRGRARPAVKYEEADPNEFVDDEPQEEEEEEEEVEEDEKDEKPPVRRHLLTLKLPRGFLTEATPDMEIVDNGDSRPTTASSEESAHTVESAYSFRPKRQKRFRDDPDGAEESAQAPPKKRGKRTSGGTATSEILSTASTPAPSIEPAQAQNNRKIQKIKVVRSSQDTKNGGAPPPPPQPPVPAVTPVEEGDDSPKDYKSMTKSEKMSASMKSKLFNRLLYAIRTLTLCRSMG
ncbi:uncharacterized protein QYS62_001465 [Fusarium acuminatum]|uniref:Uncharacterized protein n=1 Tax=Fusarium acuminatum TaxID=5515 RepID=A0ABZ2WIN2_9HYPO